ncbi:hypothetical protein BFP70_09840 [Thioclava sp. SK-1]|uniref:ExbD/TolR family protein n=1 Tax=Thioclava sp. SK-1 TaxID=1889770 RepID=UPI000825086F|nr:biopolymer transporter ExbD [Thioclava sp. SK-1]OCX65358.1 hypothetical protein BFP70_09840 [Thioclava sp. SK-1]
MQFSSPPRKANSASLLPMINVVFLLLIFFLISAQISPPEPFPTEPPESQAETEADGTFTIFLSAEGAFGFRDITAQEPEDVIAALEAAKAEYCLTEECEAEPPKLLLRADKAVPAARLAAVLPKLGAAGFAKVDLVTAMGGH